MQKLGLPSFSRKKLILIGFLFVLLIGIPLTVFLVQQQQQTRIRAEKATTLDLSPPTKTVNVGDTVELDVNLDPGGVNQVSFVEFTITYDATKLKPEDTPFTVTASELDILQGPTVDTNTITVTLAVGAAFQDAIQTPKTIGKLSFEAIAPTTGFTPVEFDKNQVQIRSLGISDTASENVFLSGEGAQITIGGAAPTPSPTPDTSATPTPTPTPAPTASPTATPITTTNSAPVCQSLTTDGQDSGTTPYLVNFTATGSDSDGTVSKVTFNFGDGIVEDVTSGSGSSSASAQASHTYSSAGTFSATATITDNSGGTSNPTTCTKVINVSSAVGGETTPPVTGPDRTFIGIGVIGAALSLIGMLLFFAL